MPSFGKTNALRAQHFEEFERLFGPDPKGAALREEGGEANPEDIIAARNREFQILDSIH